MSTAIKRIISLSGFVLIAINSFSQNCYNSDFESGDLSGYEAYVGEIQDDGTIIINTPAGVSDQHAVLSVLDDYDEIAYMYCTENQFLPVVPPVGGAYALRLGNSNVGAEAERVSIQFTVTDQTSFFLLRYAVILNDPGHLDYEQPRFRLSITDSNGNEYPCGRYEVVAAPQLENFENCDNDWKVRPWTNIGIELLSYLGEEIIIELITTDCSRGGHAGYAYLDATCQPLEIDLFNNCSDTSYAQMQVTPGFDEYVWSTGDTGSLINIQNPVVGDIYYVTVTSATGCDLVMSDTIPPYEMISPPYFDPVTDYTLCVDTAFWFTPPGTNLQKIYSVFHESFVDSVVVNTLYPGGYTFVAFSDFGCAYDTVTYFFEGEPKVLDSLIHNTCSNLNAGEIHLTPLNDISNYLYEWSTGETNPVIEDLETGDYTVTISAQSGCSVVQEFTIDGSPDFIGDVFQDDFICADSVGSVSVMQTGGLPPIAYSYDGGTTWEAISFHSYLTGGYHDIVIEDANLCRDTIGIFFDTAPLPEILEIIIVEDSCGLGNTRAIVSDVSLGTPPYEFALNNFVFGSSNEFSNLPPGDYTVNIRDANGCVGSSSFTVDAFVPFEITDLSITHTSCGEDNGDVTIVTNYSENVLYAINDLPFINSNFFSGLEGGVHLARARNDLGCEDSITFLINSSSLPSIDLIDVNYTTCQNNSNIITVGVSEGVTPYEVSLNDEDPNVGNQFFDLDVGIHEITVRDDEDCETVESFVIDPVLPFAYTVAEVIQPDCGIFNGEVSIYMSGGVGDPYIELEDEIYPEGYLFQNLEDGMYSFTVHDQSDCFFDFDVDLLAECTVYIPNVFSPNQDDRNDIFKAYIDTDVTAEVVHFNIYDVWGERIFNAERLDIEDEKCGWDGTFKGKDAIAGVYSYHIELEFYNGFIIEKSGQLTLMR